MSSLAVFCSTILQEKKKAGNLPVDANGYREMVVGGLDVCNDMGEMYVATNNVVSMFKDNSDFMKMVRKSYLRGEATHPKRMPGETADAFLQRALDVDLKNTTHHFNNLRLESAKDENGKNIILIYGSFIPSGMKGPAFKAMLENPEENIAFSIRCFTKPYMMPDGSVGKEIYHPVTFDLVNMPGIEFANKFDTPSMESASVVVTPELLECVESNSSKIEGFETVKMHTRMVRSNLGWQKIEMIPGYSSTNWGKR